MEHEVAYLACTRSIEAVYKAEVAIAKGNLEATDEWIFLEKRREYLKAAQDNVAIAETAVREEALTIYEETGDKKPHPAVPIKMYTILEYKDGEALGYARVHMPRAVKLIKRTFEKAAKVLELDFVTITQEPRATIARDLSKYLPAD